ncbi:MAG TPA: hypothetical protein VJZ69_05065 [Clostridia bacterium]|nr:hypothetical protein [Clostridia bacterium]
MKEKLMGSINYILCIIMGIATIVFLCLPAITYTTDIGLYNNGSLSYNSFQMLTMDYLFFNSTNVALLSGIFAIITTVVAALLIFVGVMMLLKKLGVYDWKFDNKVSDFNFILDTVATIFTVLAFGVFLTALFFKNANADLTHFFVKLTPVAYCLFIIPAVLCLAMWIIDAIAESKAKKNVEAPKA